MQKDAAPAADAATAHVAAVILAAGASTRMGAPKQLLRFDGITLLRRTVHAALESSALTRLVVIGAHAALVQAEFAGLPVEPVINANWQQGIGTSIRAAVDALLARPGPRIDAALMMVCDQPHISGEILDRLIEERARSGAAIVASAYAGTAGVPALFSRECFPELLALPPETGARQLLRGFRGRSAVAVATVRFDAGSIDLDTPADLARFAAAEMAAATA